MGVEACLKFASYYALFGMKTEASSILSRCLEISSILTGQEKILLLNTVAYQYYKMGFYRKFAYCMYQTSSIYHHIHQRSTQQHILSLIAKYYQIYKLDYPQIDNLNTLGDKYGWFDLQYCILNTLRKAATALHDNVNTANYIVLMLKNLGERLSSEEQQKLSRILVQVTSNNIGSFKTDMIGLPKLEKLELQKLEGLIEIPKPVTTEEVKKKEIFIHNPLAKKNVVKTGPTI